MNVPKQIFFARPFRTAKRRKTMASSIEALNLDLQIKILSHAPNIETLGSLLKATPRLYPAFSSARNIILTKVLVNTYGAELYAEALAAAKVIMLPQKYLSRSEMLSFLRHYHRSQTWTEFPVNDLPTSILMCQFHWALRYHVKCFSEPAIEFINSCAKGFFNEEVYEDVLEAHANSALSSRERVRLQRAFLRFQMYSLLFCKANATDAEKRAYFAQRLPPWEVEEIASVSSHITRGIQRTFDLAWEDFLSAYTTEADLANIVGGVVDPGEGIFDDKDALHQTRLKARMLVSGLCFLRRLFESTGEARLAMVSTKENFSHSFKPPSMNPLLGGSSATVRAKSNDQARQDPNGGEEWVYVPLQDPSSSPGSLKLVSPGMSAESSQQSTLTWQWAHAHNAIGDGTIDIYHQLRKWGYVFWDTARLRHSGILEYR